MRLLVGSQSIPKLAIAPLLVIWLGLGDAPKIVMTFILCFFPITVAMVQGLLSRARRELADAGDLGPQDVHVILTGGLSQAPFAGSIEGVEAIDPDLTLKGLAILHAEVAGGTPLELPLA